MPLVLRYVDKNGEINERFMKYIPCDTGTTGEALTQKILNTLTHDLNLDIGNCRGQCYDGAGNMAGKFSGVATRILQINNLSLYTHCASHRLNLAVATSCKLQNVKNMMEYGRKIASFFHTPKRQLLLEEMIKKHLKNYKHIKLIDPCETRWVLRIDALERFIEMYIPLFKAIEYISENRDESWEDSAGDAYGYRFGLKNFEFIITLVTVRMLLCYTKSATIQLQKSSLDIIEGLNQVSIMLKSLRTARTLIDAYHSIWFEEAKRIAQSVDATLDAPRTCDRQVYRGNSPSDNVETHYKLNVAIPFLDHLLQELNSRFSEKNCIAIRGISIVPAIMKKEYEEKSTSLGKRNWQKAFDSPSSIKESGVQANKPVSGECQMVRIQRLDKVWKRYFDQFCRQYANDLPDISSLSHEVDNWESAWIDIPDRELPHNISETLKITNKISFPNIYACLKILATFPVTSCSCERSASSVRLLKTYLRSTMTTERLNGLATIYTHKYKAIDLGKTINKFSIKNRPRLKLTNILNSNNMDEKDDAVISEIY